MALNNEFKVKNNLNTLGQILSGGVNILEVFVTNTGSLSATETVTGDIVNAKTGFRVNNVATSGHVLRGDGTNFVSSTLDAADISQAKALTKQDDSNVTITLTGSPNTALLQDVGLVLGWNGELPITRGGTGSNNGSITGSGALTFTAGGTGQDINLFPSGDGEVNIPKVDIDGGSIDNTTIGLSAPAAGFFTNLHATGNVSIDGSLFVSGSSTTINTVDLVIADPIIYLAEGNQGDVVDMGFVVAYDYNEDPTRHAGFLRNNVDKKWVLFSNLSAEVLSATNVDFDDPSLVIDTLKANIEGTLTGDVLGTVTINNGTKSVLNNVYNDSVSSGNTLTVQTFANASYNSAKFTVQIKDTTSSERCALEIIATKNNTTWEGTVYGIVDTSDLFTNVDIGVTGSNTHLEFTFNGVSNYSVTVFAQAISD
jgi:hypothetical protein